MKVRKMVWAAAFGAAHVRLSDPMGRPIDVGETPREWMRKESARLADEAVLQYDILVEEERD